MSRVLVDFRGLQRMRRMIRADMRGAGRGPLHAMFERWGQTYLQGARDRYVRQSGGGFRALAPSTQAERRRLGFNPTRPILVRAGTLFRGLFRGAPGNLFHRIVNGIRVGYGGSAAHPGYPGKPSNLTIAQIAEIHQNGGGTVPRRQIIVPPSVTSMRRMRADTYSAFQRILQLCRI